MGNGAKLAAVLAAAFLMAPAATAALTDVHLDTSERAMVHGPLPVLESIADRGDVEVTVAWMEIGWIGIEAPAYLVDALAASPDLTVEPDRVLRTLQFGEPQATPADQTPYGIEQIYDDPELSATSGGAGVVLGHIDTGIDTDHPDLVNRIVACESTVLLFGCGDDNGHGTHTAGTAAADAGDGSGIYGVAPEASIRTYKVCNLLGFCFTSDTVEAIQRCTGSGGQRVCDVITYSIGSDGASSSLHDAVRAFTDAGGLFVAAAGNDGPSEGSIDFPAAFAEAVAVGAIDSSKTVTGFSSRGVNDGDCTIEAEEVHFAAAGDDVLSTWPGDDYETLDGTSMATPHVAGLALKEWSTDGQTTLSNLESNVEDITDGQHAGSGCDAASGLGLPHVG